MHRQKSNLTVVSLSYCERICEEAISIAERLRTCNELSMSSEEICSELDRVFGLLVKAH